MADSFREYRGRRHGVAPNDRGRGRGRPSFDGPPPSAYGRGGSGRQGPVGRGWQPRGQGPRGGPSQPYASRGQGHRGGPPPQFAHPGDYYPRRPGPDPRQPRMEGSHAGAGDFSVDGSRTTSGDRIYDEVDDQSDFPPIGSREVSTERLTSLTPSISSASSTEALTGPARQKKRHTRDDVNDLAAALANITVKQESLMPHRPDAGGTTGRSCEVIVNCWDITFLEKAAICYHIEVQKVLRTDAKLGKKVEVRLPVKEKRALNNEVIKKVLPPNVIFDEGVNVYSDKPIILSDTKELKLFQTEISDPMNREQLTVEYRFEEVARLSSTDVLEFVQSKHATSLRMPQESIRLLDTVLKNVCKGSFISLGRSALFYERAEREVRDKLFNIHKGFITSVRPQWKVRLNVDMTCKAFFTAGNMADVLYDKYGEEMMRNFRLVSMDLRRIRVESLPFYKNNNGDSYRRRFTVHGITDKPAESLMIEDRQQTVSEYFKEHHGIKLTYPELPCVKVSATRAVFIPMELLEILPYQAPNAKSSDIASEVIRCAAVRPSDRMRELKAFVNQLTRSAHPLMKQFGIRVNSEPVHAPARILPTPTASFGHAAAPLERGKWKPPQFFHPASANGSVTWAILCLPPDRNATRHMELLSRMMPSTAARQNVRMEKPIMASIRKAELQHKFEEFKAKRIRLVLLVLYDDFSYSYVKQLGDLHLGIRTQCVRAKTLDKPNVIPNLLLKINGKLDGINWFLPQLAANERLMVFGADVTHPGPARGSQVQQSIAAVIGSLTPNLMRYGAVVQQQDTFPDKKNKKSREIVDSMDKIVSDLLKLYYRNTKGLYPTRLIFYRDGVSEGQFETVLLEELGAIQRACVDLSPDCQPAITYVVVQKRHHVRLIPTDPRARNVDAGTVVDTVVTQPRDFDFYLCSQEGLQGTSKPAHYHVLYDDSNWSSDALQQFTFALCHTCMRCPRSLSYPAPTYYAHLAAFRARDWLADVENATSLMSNGRFRVHDSQITGMYYL